MVVEVILVCINFATLPVLSFLFFNTLRIAFALGNASAKFNDQLINL